MNNKSVNGGEPAKAEQTAKSPYQAFLEASKRQMSEQCKKIKNKREKESGIKS